MPTILRIRRLLWMGHVWRMDSLRLPQIILNWDPVHERPDAKRPVGGQKLLYTDLLEDDLKFLRLSFHQARRATQNKSMWRSRVFALSSNVGKL